MAKQSEAASSTVPDDDVSNSGTLENVLINSSLELQVCNLIEMAVN